MRTLLAMTMTLGFLVGNLAVGQTNKVLIQKAEEAMMAQQYSIAVHYLEKTMQRLSGGADLTVYPGQISAQVEDNGGDGTLKPPSNAKGLQLKVLHRLADAYRLAHAYDKAEEWYAAADRQPHPEHPYSPYFYGVALMQNGKYEVASNQFEKVANSLDPENKFHRLAVQGERGCQFALNPENTNEELSFELAHKEVNAGSTSFGMAFIGDDKVAFTSGRMDSLFRQENGNYPEAYYDLDIYTATINEVGDLSDIQRFAMEVNSDEFHDAAMAATPDGSVHFFTRKTREGSTETAIYASRYFQGAWRPCFKLDENINQPGTRSMTPFVSPDGTKLFFASDRPGGQGGLDLYVCKILLNGKFSKPESLGNKVNTPGDEMSPFWHEEKQALYFASDGHVGFGGKDIYAAKWNSLIEWYDQPYNVGAPINSSKDDNFYISDPRGVLGFVSSDREPCSDCDTADNLKAHCLRMYKIGAPEIHFTVSGFVYDEETDEPIAGATVEIIDPSFEQEPIKLITDEDGYYFKEIPGNMELINKASSEGYLYSIEYLDTRGYTSSYDFEQDHYLRKIPKGEVAIDGIEYDLDSDKIRPSSHEALDKLVQFLREQDNLSVEIQSHTDFRGSDSYNLDLSQRRAQSVVNYLVEHGIDKERLKPTGYGETQPRTIDFEGEEVQLSEDFIKKLMAARSAEVIDMMHQKNRRTAFKITEVGGKEVVSSD